jgi:fimbrial chaperone protein
MRLLKFVLLVLVLLAGLPRPLAAQGFSALVSPPRFEIAVKPGEVTRQVMEITNASPLPATFRMHTSDWTIDADATVTLTDALGPGSCRPWVAIEAREITIRGGGKYRYRFEINPPADANGECRFAVVVEGFDENVDAGGNLKIPINGRLGIIVYATLPGAEPKLEIVDSEVAAVNGQMLPVLHVRNSGSAHGRIAGLLSGTDASGKRIDFAPSGLPILPNETRRIVLGVSGEGSQSVTIAYPITIRGNLEWGDRSTPLDQRFAP